MSDRKRRHAPRRAQTQDEGEEEMDRYIADYVAFTHSVGITGTSYNGEEVELTFRTPTAQTPTPAPVQAPRTKSLLRGPDPPSSVK